jgi:hypothetical protein
MRGIITIPTGRIVGEASTMMVLVVGPRNTGWSLVFVFQDKD